MGPYIRNNIIVCMYLGESAAINLCIRPIKSSVSVLTRARHGAGKLTMISEIIL